MAGRVGIEVEGLQEVRRAFAKAGNKKELDRGLRASHKKIGKQVESRSKAGAASGTRQQQKAIRALLGRGEPDAAIIALRNNAAVPFGIGAFMGALAWKQFPAWVGTAWDIAAGDGPYVVADAIAKELPEIEETYAEGMRDTLNHLGLHVS